MEAALGVGQLQRWPTILKARQQNAAWLIEHLQPFEQWLQLPVFDSQKQEHAFMMLPVVIKEDAPFTKFDLVSHLEDWNVETREMMPLINQPCYKWMNTNEDDFPVAKWVNNCGFYIGCHQGLSEADMQYMVDVFGSFLRGKGLIS
jgi:perosamine synthetase